MYLTFGKYGPGADHRQVQEIPSGYLRWMQEQDDMYEKRADLMEAVDEEMAIRDRSDAHWEE